VITDPKLRTGFSGFYGVEVSLDKNICIS